MTTRYHRNNYIPEQLESTIAHVRSHISSCCSPTDDPNEFFEDVLIEVSANEDGSRRVFGLLDREPVADYSIPDDYVAPEENEYQLGFGERFMTPEELQNHLIQKEIFG